MVLSRFKCAILLLAAAIIVPSSSQESDTAVRPICPDAGQVLFYLPDTSLDRSFYAEFGDELQRELAAALPAVGYCLHRPADIGRYTSDTAYAEHLILTVAARGVDSGHVLLAGLIQISRAGGAVFETALAHPLAEVGIDDAGAQTLRTVLVKKIIENLRAAYVCHLAIESNPDSIRVATESGLEATTPVEWIVALGTVEITASREDYAPFHKKIKLNTPGYHKVYIELNKRRFYHSPWIYSAVACLAASGVFYGLERYYYDKYQSLGEHDYLAQPDAFGDTFDKAQIFERCAGASLGLAVVSLVLSFRF